MGHNVGMHDWTVATHSHHHFRAKQSWGEHNQSRLERRSIPREQGRLGCKPVPRLWRHLVRYDMDVVPEDTTDVVLWRCDSSDVPAGGQRSVRSSVPRRHLRGAFLPFLRDFNQDFHRYTGGGKSYYIPIQVGDADY